MPVTVTLSPRLASAEALLIVRLLNEPVDVMVCVAVPLIMIVVPVLVKVPLAMLQLPPIL